MGNRLRTFDPLTEAIAEGPRNCRKLFRIKALVVLRSARSTEALLSPGIRITVASDRHALECHDRAAFEGRSGSERSTASCQLCENHCIAARRRLAYRAL